MFFISENCCELSLSCAAVWGKYIYLPFLDSLYLCVTSVKEIPFAVKAHALCGITYARGEQEWFLWKHCCPGGSRVGAQSPGGLPVGLQAKLWGFGALLPAFPPWEDGAPWPCAPWSQLLALGSTSPSLEPPKENQHRFYYLFQELMISLQGSSFPGISLSHFPLTPWTFWWCTKESPKACAFSSGCFLSKHIVILLTHPWTSSPTKWPDSSYSLGIFGF